MSETRAVCAVISETSHLLFRITGNITTLQETSPSETHTTATSTGPKPVYDTPRTDRTDPQVATMPRSNMPFSEEEYRTMSTAETYQLVKQFHKRAEDEKVRNEALQKRQYSTKRQKVAETTNDRDYTSSVKHKARSMFPSAVFITDKQKLYKLTKMVIMGVPCELDFKTDEGVQFLTKKTELYTEVVNSVLSEMRTAAQNRAKTLLYNSWVKSKKTVEFEETTTEAQRLAILEKSVPTERILYDCLKRKVDIDTEEGFVLFEWYYTKYLPAVAGAKYWNEKHWYYQTLTEAGKPSRGDRLYGVTPMIEALGLLIMENSRDKWLDLFPLMNRLQGKVTLYKKKTLEDMGHYKDPSTITTQEDVDGWQSNGSNEIRLAHEDFQTQYTLPTSGQNKFAGYSPEGLKRFKHIYDMVRRMRDPNVQGNTYTSTVIYENRFMEKLRAKYGIRGMNHDEQMKMMNRRASTIAAPPEHVDIDFGGDLLLRDDDAHEGVPV